MNSEVALFLWRRRISARTKTILTALKLVVDFWTALYIVIPALILLVVSYCKLLAALPAWFTPEWEALLAAGLAWFMAGGNIRCYLKETDLTFLYPDSRGFHVLFNIGLLSSLAINALGLLLLIMGLFPFYLHLESVAMLSWLGIGLWLIILRIAFLLIIFLLRTRAARWAFRLFFFTGFIIAWKGMVLPFMHSGGLLYLEGMVATALFMAVLALVVKSTLPVNWMKAVQDEVDCDIRLLGRLLGYAGQLERKRNGTSIWSQRRLGIPFRRKYTWTYFGVKYLLRSQYILSILMGIGAVCLMASISAISYWAELGFLAAAVLMSGLLFRSLVIDNQEKLDIYTRALDVNDRQAGLKILYNVISVPFIIFPVFSGLAGTMSSMQVLGGIIILGVWVPAATRIILNFSLTNVRMKDLK